MKFYYFFAEILLWHLVRIFTVCLGPVFWTHGIGRLNNVYKHINSQVTLRDQLTYASMK